MLVQKKWLARLTAASLLLGLVAQNAQSDNGDSVNVDVVLAVVNESEALLEARIDVISEAYGLDISRTKSGHYAVRGTHRWHARSERDRTFLIEIKVSGYKPRVLEFGRDFQARKITCVLYCKKALSSGASLSSHPSQAVLRQTRRWPRCLTRAE